MSECIVGVIGGMGPDATVELMQRVIRLTPAQDDADHIHMLVDNNPKVPSRIKALLEGGGDNPGPVIAQMAKRLEQGGADFLVIPCNTAHYYHYYAQDAVGIPVWHLIELALNQWQQTYPNAKRVGLLASSAVQKIHLFESFFEHAGLELVYPSDEAQTVIMQLIRAVKAATVNDALLAEYHQAIATMESSVDGYLLGCSELSVLWQRHETALPVMDSLQVLAEAIVEAAS